MENKDLSHAFLRLCPQHMFLVSEIDKINEPEHRPGSRGGALGHVPPQFAR